MTKTFTKPTDVYMDMVGRVKQDFILQFPVRVVHRTIRDALIEAFILRRLQRQP